MSYYKKHFEPLVLYEKKREPDGAGGWHTGWFEGAKFEGYVGLKGSGPDKIAAAITAVDTYSCAVDKGFPIEYNDYFKREADGAFFHVTNNPDDQKTPDTSALDVMEFTAVRVPELPE